MGDTFLEQLSAKTEEVNKIVSSYLPAEEGYQKEVMSAMHYALLAGGKRLRPLLMYETYKMFGGTSEAIKPFMAAIEYIHTYSLIHDDLPAMDNDDYRRGQLTTHKKYGEAMGVLAGDALLNYAFETAGSALELEPSNPNVGKAFLVLARKAGIYGMIGGQVVDVAHEKNGTQMTADMLDFIYRLKTGALIEASLKIGAILADASKEEQDAVEQIAAKVGMAFQIQDDILDITSSFEELGKPIGSDEKNNKETYVDFFGIDAAKDKVKALSEEAVQMLETLPNSNPFLGELIISLIDRRK